MTKNPFFSIVIPTLNEEETIPLILADLTMQSYQEFEVIHVDGSSKDRTVAVAEDYKNKLKIKSITVKKRNVSFQRNIGGKRAKGKWIIFMDADNRIPAYFLDGIRYQIAKNSNCDLFTTWIETDEENRMYKVIARAINTTFLVYESLGNPVAFGALIGVKRSVFLNHTFDEKQKVVEDSYFVKEAYKKGYVFCLFKEPQFTYSLRRIKKEGNIKMAYTTAKIQLRFLAGKKFDKNNYGYVMKGGTYYKTPKTPLFNNLHNFIVDASEKQLKHAQLQMKKFFRNLN